MGIYMATRIMSGALDYDYVILKRPDLKEDIDNYLIQEGMGHLITQPSLQE